MFLRAVSTEVYVYRFLGDLCTADGGCDGNGGRAAVVDAVVGFVVIGADGVDGICGCWDGIGVETTDVGATGAQIVGWRRVAVVVWGWNNAPNGVVVARNLRGEALEKKLEEILK